ncbi:SMP protein [Vibrio sp. SM6]|uniref:SMP protein n=1 Tax=Vibrio agarilyticus TaxID=2726741 RepID=A0A7X8TPS6_9VIBR|nr:YtjB family periplasmic protein [Vibrio agarilyticus]NLS12702.1 SMP protein [Vibrio agarilyticus]
MNESLFSWRNALRILALMVLSTMLFITIQNTVVISQGNGKIQAQQLETLTKVLISQASLSASELLRQDDPEHLRRLANQLAQDNLVFDASIYNAEGVRLAASDSATSVRDVLGLDTPLATASIGRQQLVEPIYQDNHIVGFVRLTFETGKVTAISDHHYRKSDRYMLLMVLMSFLGGAIFIVVLRKKPQAGQANLLLENQD